MFEGRGAVLILGTGQRLRTGARSGGFSRRKSLQLSLIPLDFVRPVTPKVQLSMRLASLVSLEAQLSAWRRWPSAGLTVRISTELGG
jgi:hypothetical protein